VAPNAGSPIDVSIAHSGGWVACGFAAYRLVGIDVEEEERDYDVENMAARVFTARERTAFEAINRLERRYVFLEAWRLKEAVLKGLGRGLAADPALLDVFSCDAQGKFVGMDTVLAGRCRWRVHASRPVDGPAIALAFADASDLVSSACDLSDR
jgi:4'-phosphopantetheinyl transferase